MGEIKLKDLNLRVVNLFYQSLLEQGAGQSQVRYTHRVLHAALQHALKDGFICPIAARTKLSSAPARLQQCHTGAYPRAASLA